MAQPNAEIYVTYVWIDQQNEFQSITQPVSFVPQSPEELNLIQADEENSDVFLLPAKIYRDPFRMGNSRLVLCETVTCDRKPTTFNTRHECNLIMKQAAEHEPWFGIEQEFFLMKDGQPLGWTDEYSNVMLPIAQGVGTYYAKGRVVLNILYAACLYSGVKIDGLTAEAGLAQWEYQIGPCLGINIGDDLTMSRFLLKTIAKDFDLEVTFHPKPIADSLFGSGGHTNFSTKAMREDGGISAIKAAMPKLEKNHLQHIVKYDLNEGRDNAQRLVAGPVTEAWDKFSWSVGDRTTSIRIPKAVEQEGKGYFEDRRPASNLDAFLVSRLLVQTVCLDM